MIVPSCHRWRSEQGAYHIIIHKAGPKFLHCIIIDNGAIRSKRLPVSEEKYMSPIDNMTVEQAAHTFREIASWFSVLLTNDAREFLGLQPRDEELTIEEIEQQETTA